MTISLIKGLCGKCKPWAAMNSEYLWLTTPYSAYRMKKDSMTAADLMTVGFRLTYSAYPYKEWDILSPNDSRLLKKPLEYIDTMENGNRVYKVCSYYVCLNPVYFAGLDIAYMKGKKGSPHKSPVMCFNANNEMIAVVMPVMFKQDAAKEKYGKKNAPD